MKESDFGTATASAFAVAVAAGTELVTGPELVAGAGDASGVVPQPVAAMTAASMIKTSRGTRDARRLVIWPWWARSAAARAPGRR
ncbi:hypothetical protein Aca07nite_75690 [Actinoplanes capillaceus]|uniref:Uncharacterized protein n=1 Tax=Actinoplanes campanulatus TaxID=113559 RepID=A0ABQ3WVS2_9ACTN|nr:hypothetical protein Aca07nite_75690 [Actinoplanes capillaceus]